MKVCGGVALVALAVAASVPDAVGAVRYLAPQITLALSHGDGKTGSLEPHLKWTAEHSAGDMDLEGGVDVRVKDFESLPYSVWGKVKRSIFGWSVSAHGVVDSMDPESVDLDVRAEGGSTNLQVLGRKEGKDFSVHKVNVKQGISAPFGQLILKPSYTVASSSIDMTVGYDMDGGLGVEVTGNADDQKLTLSRSVGDRNLIRPSITRSGAFALDVSRQMDVGQVTASFRPSDSLNLKWEDGPWMANVRAPIEGYWFDGDAINVSVKRKVDI